MAGMDEYFGPRRKGAFDDFSVYDEKNDAYSYPKTRWNDDGIRREESVAHKRNTLRQERDICIVPAPTLKSSDALNGNDEEIFVLRHIRNGISLAANALCHPFVVLRRQCQVHNTSHWYHLSPVTLFPAIYYLNQRQGITTLWKGIGSGLLVSGMSLAVEDLISKVTPWPKEFKSNGTLKIHGQHLMLKCLTIAIVTPFYSASLVESVQSDIASEAPGALDVFREGVCRLVNLGSPQKGRMLPIWRLVVPSVLNGVLKHLIGIIIHNISAKILRLSYEINKNRMDDVPTDYRDEDTERDIEIYSEFIATVGGEIVLYPLETILHRLCLQGTRTIIDNLDTGRQVVPILTSYDGALDCYYTILREEGGAGLYKGFGALILQFAVHYLLIKVTKVVFSHVAHLIYDHDPPPPLPSLPPPPPQQILAGPSHISTFKRSPSNLSCFSSSEA